MRAGDGASIFFDLNLDESADLREAEARLSKLTEAIAGMLGVTKNFEQVYERYHRKHFGWARPAAEVEMGNVVEFAPVKIKPRLRGTVLSGKDMLRRRLGGSGRNFAGYGSAKKKKKKKNIAEENGAERPLSASSWSDTDMHLEEMPPIRSGPTRPPAGVAAWESPGRGQSGRHSDSRGGKNFLLAPIPREGTPLGRSASRQQHDATRSLDAGSSPFGRV